MTEAEVFEMIRVRAGLTAEQLEPHIPQIRELLRSGRWPVGEVIWMACRDFAAKRSASSQPSPHPSLAAS